MMNHRFQKKILHLTPSKSLIEMAEKKKLTVLAEKFLVSAHEKNLTVLRALGEDKQRLLLFRHSLVFVPLGILAYFCIPQMFFELLVHNEIYCRASVSLLLGCMFCNAFALDRLGVRAFFAIPLFFFFGFFLADQDFYIALLGDEAHMKLFFCLGSGFFFPCLVYFPSYVYWRFSRWMAGCDVPFLSKYFVLASEKELEEQLQQALQYAGDANAKELAKLVQDYTPEYTSILEGLRDTEMVAPPFPNLDASPSREPKGLAMPMYIGKNSAGEDKYVDLDASPHMLVAGTTGGGKSNFVEHYICSLLAEGGSHLYVIDPSDDLYGYAGNEHVTYVSQASKAREVVSEVAAEIEKRALLFKSKKGVRKLSQWVGEGRPERLFVVFDEYANFSSDQQLAASIDKIVRLGRKYGIHLLLATQSPRAEVFKGSIKDNINTKVAFRAATAAHAAVLGEPLARTIKESQKGLAVVGGEYVQTPLCDNRRWWDDEAQEAVEPALALPSRQKFVPAEREAEGAFFLSKEELQEALGEEPTQLGFQIVRNRIDGQRRRGAWVKRES